MNSEAIGNELDPAAVILDASVVGAVIFDEPGSVFVLSHLTCGVISAVNMSEIAAKAISRGGELHAVWEMLSRFSLKIMPLDDDQAFKAASFYPITHEKGISFADRACMALAS